MKQWLRLLMLTIIYLIGFPRAYLVSRHKTNRHMHESHSLHSFPSHPRILLIRPDHLGDLVMTTPVLDALRKHVPNADITMMVGPWSSEIVARHPAIDHLIACPFPGFRRAAQGPLAPYILLFQTAQQLRRQQYDLAINLRPDFWWGAALLYLAAIPRRVGYAISSGTPFLTSSQPFRTPEHATVSNLRLVSSALHALGRPPLDEPCTPEDYPLVFKPTSDEQVWVEQRLYENGIDEGTSIVVIHAGTGAAVKLWRNEAWVTCANKIMSYMAEHATPVHIILTGSPTEHALLTEIANGMHIRPLVITDATVGQLAALMQRATLVLGTDTGPLHLAVAQGTPTLHIFGPTDPRIFGPWGSATLHVVIAATQRCPTCPTIPCGRLDISVQDLPAHPCTSLVSEQSVEQAALRLLDTTATIDYKKSHTRLQHG